MRGLPICHVTSALTSLINARNDPPPPPSPRLQPPDGTPMEDESTVVPAGSVPDELAGRGGVSKRPHVMLGRVPPVRILEAELFPIPLAKARGYGLNDSWVQVIPRPYSHSHYQNLRPHHHALSSLPSKQETLKNDDDENPKKPLKNLQPPSKTPKNPKKTTLVTRPTKTLNPTFMSSLPSLPLPFPRPFWKPTPFAARSCV